MNNIFQDNVNPHSLDTAKYKPQKISWDGNGGKIDRYSTRSQKDGET